MPETPAGAVAALVGVAAAADADPRLFDPRRDLEDAITHLRALPGVGEWTAQYVAMRAMGESDAFLAGDVAVQRALAEGGRRPTVPEVLARAERWRPWRAYAVLHLWLAEPHDSRTPLTRRITMRLRLERRRSPLSNLLLVTDDAGVLRALEYADHEARMHRLLQVHYATYTLSDGAAPASVTRALDAYFEGDAREMGGVAVETGGTPFQREVWRALRAIPVGTTVSYGQLAAGLGRPGASRAVGAANGSNPISIVVPCHRVIGANGTLTGYASGLTNKSWLLDHEREMASGLAGVARRAERPHCLA